MVFRMDEREGFVPLRVFARSKTSFEEMEANATNTAEGGEWRSLAELLANIQCLRVIIQVLNHLVVNE